MKIKAHCPFLGHTGYNAHARGFFTALSDLVDLRVDNYTWCDDRHNYLTKQQKRIISEITLSNNDGTEGQYPPDWKEEIEDFKYDVDIVLHEHGHHHFWRDYQKPKIAYVVWETDWMLDDFFARLLEYDQLWVASKWQRGCAIDQGYPAERVKVVPEAVEADCFIDPTTKPDDSVFTFCLVGRWDNRKSTTEILECFVELFGNNPKVQLIASINNPFALDDLSSEERLKKMGWGNIKNIILKSFPSRSDYLDILRRSHVFLSCARSEGWNIPLIEAMACGIPSIYSDCSGQTEFASGKGVPIRILGKELAHVGHGAVASQFTSNMPGHYFSPDFAHLKKKMQDCIDSYDALKARALKESREIKSEYTWANAALLARKHLDNLYSEHKTLSHKNRSNVNVLIEADDKYLQYAITCIKSIRKYSSYNIVLYGYDTDFEGSLLPSDIEVRRLHRWPLSRNGRDLGMSSRISMCLDALKQKPSDLFIVIDADMIAVKELDSFFSEQFDRLEAHPLCITYKHDNLIHFNIKPDGTKVEKGHGDEAASVFGVEPRWGAPHHPIDFTVAQGIFIFDKKSEPFLTELLTLSLEALDKEPRHLVDNMAFESERIHNTLIWKYGFTQYLPLAWVSKDEDNDFLVPELKQYIDLGFDVVYTCQDRRSYDIKFDQLLFLHGKSSLLPPSSQLMIVAHPDDETIFGFTELDKGGAWKVVCVTPDGRQEDFHKAMRFYGVDDYEIWDFDSSLTTDFPHSLLDRKINSLIEEKTWHKIVTHNPIGEYGHRQHKNIFDAVKKHCDDFYVFCKTPQQLSVSELERKREALNIYKSQNIIFDLEHLYGNWMMCNDMSTNYIEHGSVERYDVSKDTSPFVNCCEKASSRVGHFQAPLPGATPKQGKLKEVFLITSYCDNAEKIQLLKETLQYLKPLYIPMCVHDAAGVEEDLIKAGADYLIVDPSNPMPSLRERSAYSAWPLPCDQNIVLNSHSLDIGGAATHQLQSGLSYLSSVGYDVVHVINYDVFIDYNFFSNSASPKALKYDVVLYYWETRMSACFFSINLARCDELIRSLSFESYMTLVPAAGHYESYIEQKVLDSSNLKVERVPFKDFKDLVYDKMSSHAGAKNTNDGTFDHTMVFRAALTPKTRFWFGRKKTLEMPENGPPSVIFYDVKEDFEAKLIVNWQVFQTKVEKSKVINYFLFESTIKGDDIKSAQLIIDGDVMIDEVYDNLLLNSIEFKK